MRFPELDPFRLKEPRLTTALFDELEAFLSEVLTRRPWVAHKHAAHDISSVIVANRLGVNEGVALLLLRYAEEAGIVMHRYDVYCPVTDLAVESFQFKSDLPKAITCPFEAATEHTIQEYFVDLVFEFSDHFIESHTIPA
jgi:hypothetical protein